MRIFVAMKIEHTTHTLPHALCRCNRQEERSREKSVIKSLRSRWQVWLAFFVCRFHGEWLCI